MASGFTEDELLSQLAERPDDRALRLVFADWLEERGDPRGEVIALWARGSLSLTERRRLQRLTEQHGAAWLGRLAEVADVARCRFEGGFPVEVVLVPRGDIAWELVTGDPHWATVRSLVFPLSLAVSNVSGFLCHPVLRRLERLEVGASVLAQLKGPLQPAFALHTVAVASWGTFEEELAALREAEGLKGAKRLELATSEFVNPIIARDIRDAVLARTALLGEYEELRLLAPYGVMEGIGAWLAPGSVLGLLERTWTRGTAWSVAFSDVVFRLERTSDGLFRRLSVDLTGPEGTLGLGQRLATVAGVLVLLAAARLGELEVLLPDGARLRSNERDALRAAVRRLGTVQVFRIAGLPVTP